MKRVTMIAATFMAMLLLLFSHFGNVHVLASDSIKSGYQVVFNKKYKTRNISSIVISGYLAPHKTPLAWKLSKNKKRLIPLGKLSKYKYAAPEGRSGKEGKITRYLKTKNGKYYFQMQFKVAKRKRQAPKYAYVWVWHNYVSPEQVSYFH